MPVAQREHDGPLPQCTPLRRIAASDANMTSWPAMLLSAAHCTSDTSGRHEWATQAQQQHTRTRERGNAGGSRVNTCVQCGGSEWHRVRAGGCRRDSHPRAHVARGHWQELDEAQADHDARDGGVQGRDDVGREEG